MHRGLRLVKAQVASQPHECAECPETIEVGERYFRAAIPGDGCIFPTPNVPQSEAWQYVNHEWTIEKTHELCYTARYYKPVALSNDDFVGGKPLSVDVLWGRVECGHKSYAGTSNCAEIACGNYAGSHWTAR
jgi:hypothetical protein